MEKNEKTIETFIAEDGTEFASEAACLQYEEELQRDARLKDLEEKVNGYQISAEEAQYIPLEIYASERFNLRDAKSFLRKSSVTFYRLENKDQLKELAEYISLKEQIVSAKEVIRRARIKGYPCIAAKGFELGWDRELHSIWSDTEKINKFLSVNGYEEALQINL